jgi:hypothetical protein
VGGDYWIAPKQVGEAIVLTSVTTGGADAGLEVNPVSPNKHGFLSCVAGSSNPILASSYDPTLNLATSLPYTVAVNSSLVKATRKTSGCALMTGLPSGDCCIDSYDVLTVLPTAPVNNGIEAFRPGFAGSTKTLYYLSNFDFTVLPSLASVSTAVYFKEHTDDFASVHTRWHTPFVDHYMDKLGDPGRAFVPLGTPSYSVSLSNGYGADISSAYLGNLIRGAMGNEPLAVKMPALTGLLQRGIDLYASYKAGIRWPSGAAQQLGRKPPIAFFAALVTDAAIKAEVSALAGGNANLFHEDGQIQLNAAAGNIPLWGDRSCTENTYWANVFAEQQYVGGSLVEIGGGDNVKTCADPYGWIDGPGGLPGTEYMENATGPIIGYQVAQSLMSTLCTAANDSHLSLYSRRMLPGGGGIRTQPDVCAPPDPAEAPGCTPFNGGAGCTFYGVTWGPVNVAIPNGNCILNGPGQIGRFPARNGAFLANIFSEPQIAKVLRLADVTLMNNCN